MKRSKKFNHTKNKKKLETFHTNSFHFQNKNTLNLKETLKFMTMFENKPDLLEDKGLYY